MKELNEAMRMARELVTAVQTIAGAHRDLARAYEERNRLIDKSLVFGAMTARCVHEVPMVDPCGDCHRDD